MARIVNAGITTVRRYVLASLLTLGHPLDADPNALLVLNALQTRPASTKNAWTHVLERVDRMPSAKSSITVPFVAAGQDLPEIRLSNAGLFHVNIFILYAVFAVVYVFKSTLSQ